MMTTHVETFDFDIQPSTTHVSRNILPDGEAEVTFQVSNTGDCRQRAEAILEPLSGPLATDEWAYWLQLLEPPEYDYQPQSMHTYTAKIRVGDLVTPGTYTFRLLLVGHDDPDHEYLASDKVSFNVAIPPASTRWLVIGLIVLVALVLIGGVIAMRLLTPPGGLDISFEYDDTAEVGILKPYTLELTNKLGDIPAKNVVMEYIYPEGVEDAWANVEIKNPAKTGVALEAEPVVVTHCGSTDNMLRCALGEIKPGQNIILTIYVLPGPNLPKTEDGKREIINQDKFRLHWMVNTTSYDKDLFEYRKSKNLGDSIVQDATNSISGAAIPAIDFVPVGLPAKVTLFGWSNKQVDEPVVLKYSLPEGMRFAGYDPACQQEPADYSTLVCSRNDQVKTNVVKFNVLVIPMQPSTTGYAQVLQGSETESGVYQNLNTEKVSLQAADNQLVFNGVNEWAQLGPNSLPKTFTMTMWVNPDSLEDDQALIGVHNQSTEEKKVINKFLVGYYNGSIIVEVMGEYHLLDLAKTSGPFHLVIVVDKNENDKPVVTAYITADYKDLKDGLPVPVSWQDCSEDGTDTGSKKKCLFDKPITDSKDPNDFNWVIGQEWDAYGSDIVPSDFFHGAVSDVRIFGSALTKEQVAENMYLPLRCVEKEPVIQGQQAATIQVQPPVCYDSQYSKTKSQANKYSLIGWWPLAPTDQATEDLQAGCFLPIQGQLDVPQDNSPCMLVDLGPNSYNGARSGGTWESEIADFGDALAFNGSNVLYLDSVLLSDFTDKTNTTVIKAKATPTPIPSIVVNTVTPIPTPSLNKPTNTPALIATETALKATQTALAATQTAMVATQEATPTSTTTKESPTPSELGGVPLTIATWIYIDTIPSQQQTILAMDNEKERVRIIIASDGHVQALYEKKGSNNWVARDEKSIPAGRWIHYAVVLWFDKDTGTLTQDEKYGPMLLLFRDGQRVKTTPTPTITPMATNASTTPSLSSNLALNKSAMASASCSLNEGPAKAVNGSWTAGLGDKWCDNTSASKWWQVDLGANFNINQFIVRHAGAGGEITTLNTRDFNIQVSMDGANWTTVVTVTGNTDNTTTHHIATTMARYVRLNVITPEQTPTIYGAARIYEVEVYSATGIPAGLHLGGLKTVVNGIVKDIEGFTGRIDEVRIWNRALYNPVNNTSHISPEIDFWLRLPGVAFDEYVYWSFDSHKGEIALGLCQNKPCASSFSLPIQGPAWVPNDLSIDFAK